jgi:hypothetical protein
MYAKLLQILCRMSRVANVAGEKSVSAPLERLDAHLKAEQFYSGWWMLRRAAVRVGLL